tara:strand:+ start:2055 stop:2387 length:333 start_codon:yes stop_codon:yes gene_type:complete
MKHEIRFNDKVYPVRVTMAAICAFERAASSMTDDDEYRKERSFESVIRGQADIASSIFDGLEADDVVKAPYDEAARLFAEMDDIFRDAIESFGRIRSKNVPTSEETQPSN